MDRSWNAVRRLAAAPLSSGALALAALAVALTPAGAWADSCPNARFRTGLSAHLPDCRAYELVSPQDTNNGEVDHNTAAVGGTVNAAPSGGRVAYTLTQGLDDASGLGQMAGYLADRGAGGWLTRAIQPPAAPNAGLAYAGIIHALTADLTKEVVLTNTDPTTLVPLPGSAPFGGAQAVYLRDNAAGTYRLITPIEAREPGEQMRINLAIAPDGAAAFIAIGVSSPGASQFTWTFRRYETATGQLENVAILPDGSESVSAQPAGGFRLLQHAFADDGNVVFFSDDASGVVYRRDLRTGTTAAINASENTTQSVPLDEAAFEGASADGSQAFFASAQPLVDGDTNSGRDLYRYDATKPAGERLTAITSNGAFAQNFTYVIRTADDGSRIYFAEAAQLVSGVPAAPLHSVNLYLWDDTGAAPVIKYIATLALADATKAAGDDSAVSAHGRYLAFLAATSGITAADTAGHAQVYLYDAERSTVTVPDLACASCVASPAASTAAAEFQFSLSRGSTWGSTSRRNLLATGQLFFETTEALVPEDTNGRMDVYEYEDGQVHLISTGRGSYDAYFGDATASGDDVYLYTPNQLTATDTSGRSALYDARVGGGFASPAPPVAPCIGEQCHGSAPTPPGLPAAATVSFAGAGNVAEGSSQETSERGGKVRVARHVTVRRGAFRLTVRVPAAGRITTRGPRVRLVKRTVAKAAAYRVRVVLTRAARRLLARRGVAHVRVRVVFEPRHGRASSAVVRVTVRRPLARRGARRSRVAVHGRRDVQGGHRRARGRRSATAKGGR